MFASGWKLNPVVGAVYSPEFYAGKNIPLLVDFILCFLLWKVCQVFRV